MEEIPPLRRKTKFSTRSPGVGTRPHHSQRVLPRPDINSASAEDGAGPAVGKGEADAPAGVAPVLLGRQRERPESQQGGGPSAQCGAG